MNQIVSLKPGARVLIPFALTLSFLPCAFAQETTAGIQGLVKDPSGAVIAGANVEVTSPALLGARKVTTDQSGCARIH